jgi:hypothetical protein
MQYTKRLYRPSRYLSRDVIGFKKILICLTLLIFFIDGVNGTMTIDPVGNHSAGEIIFINGTTTDPVTGNITLYLDTFCNTNRPHMKSEIDPEYSTLSDIQIIQGENGTNRWSVNITDFAINVTPRTHCQVQIQDHNSTYLWFRCDPECDHWWVNGNSAAFTDFYIFQNSENMTNISPYYGYQTILPTPTISKKITNPPLIQSSLLYLILIIGIVTGYILVYVILVKKKQ